MSEQRAKKHYTNLPRSFIPSAAEFWLLLLPVLWFELLLKLLITLNEYFVKNAPNDSIHLKNIEITNWYTKSSSSCRLSFSFLCLSTDEKMVNFNTFLITNKTQNHFLFHIYFVYYWFNICFIINSMTKIDWKSYQN